MSYIARTRSYSKMSKQDLQHERVELHMLLEELDGVLRNPSIVPGSSKYMKLQSAFEETEREVTEIEGELAVRGFGSDVEFELEMSETAVVVEVEEFLRGFNS